MQTQMRTAKWERASAPPEDWRNLLLDARQEEEVLTLVRDHMARFAPEEIALLPEDCRPPRIRHAEDLGRWAFELASTDCAGIVEGEDEEVLQRMLEFATRAAVRLSELTAVHFERP
jgi:hypothetical protein